jgi:hypothetical protein
MSDIKECREMELWCLQRARTEPGNHWKWVGQAERWRELARSQISFNFQKDAPQQQQMHAGPMAMGPNTINGDLRGKQLG